ncbi:MAG: response regulator transcription factor [Phycisphaerales bacterium]|jgi:two-component system phosphate regulon response regulator PhoB|nr:response regulator transcription factor [Phycisphaerales bacterium]
MQERARILVVDDERDLVDLLKINLSRAGFRVDAAHTGREALAKVASSTPDLVVLDLMLPELSGLEVASRLRADPATARLPIVMLTAKGEDVDQIVGLSVGADDYIPKPFSHKVLIARIEAVLRRSQTRAPVAETSAARLAMGPLELDLHTHQANLSGQPLKLTLTEFRLLSALLRAGGTVLSRQKLMSKAMGPGVMVTERTIDVHVTSVRKKLGDAAPMIETVRGVGYRAAWPIQVSVDGVDDIEV